MRRLEGLLLMATHLGLPTVATFEEPEKNGYLPAQLEAHWPEHGVRLEKSFFDCCADPVILSAIEGMERRQLLVAGAETDVCVLQSVLSLLQHGYQVFLLEVSCSARSVTLRRPVRRMEAAGAVPLTLKTAFYELKRRVGIPQDDAWPEGGWERLIGRFGSPEALPPWESGV